VRKAKELLFVEKVIASEELQLYPRVLSVAPSIPEPYLLTA
jgi:hypothetical protein